MIDPNVIRWLYTSAAKHFDDAAKKANIPFYLNSYKGDEYWAEFRFDGPHTETYTIGTFKLVCTVNILITSFISDNDYKIFDLVGVFASAANRDICVYKYGDGEQDDQSPIGTLQLRENGENKIDIVHYGIITAEAQQKRSSVEAVYELN